MKLSLELQEFLQECDEKFEKNQFSFSIGEPINGVSRALKILGRQHLLNELKKHHRKNDINMFVDDEWLHITML